MPALTPSSLASIPLCFASCSIGSPSDPLPDRLSHLANAGFTHIELSFPDLQAFASSVCSREVGEEDWDALCEAGERVKELCKERGLQVFILQPFGQFEGWKEGTKEREDVWRRVDGWIRIMKAVATDRLQVGSSDVSDPNCDLSRSSVVKDLRLLCDKLKEADPSFKLAYENWCWSTHASKSWEVWEIVKEVDRDNIGVNLDTFQHAGAEWADPTQVNGLTASPDREAAFQRSLSLLRQIPPEKIAFLQISDAYKVCPPLSPEVKDGLRPRGRWSHDYRPFPFSGGYLPVVEVTQAVLETGFRGVLSLEVFDGGQDGKGKEGADPGEFAKEGMRSLRELLEECAEE